MTQKIKGITGFCNPSYFFKIMNIIKPSSSNSYKKLYLIYKVGIKLALRVLYNNERGY